jgi:hypothetical protein
MIHIVPPLPASRITGPYDPSSPRSPSPSPYSPIFSGIISFNPFQSLPRTGLDGLLGTLSSGDGLAVGVQSRWVVFFLISIINFGGWGVKVQSPDFGALFFQTLARSEI